MKNKLSDFSDVAVLKKHPLSNQIDDIFRSVIKEEVHMEKKPESNAEVADPGEISLGNIDTLDIGLSNEPEVPSSDLADEGLELTFNSSDNFELGDSEISDPDDEGDTQFGDLSFEDDDELSLDDNLDLGEDSHEEVIEDLGDLDLPPALEAGAEDNLDLSDLDSEMLLGDDSLDGLSLSEDEDVPSTDGLSLDLGLDDDLSLDGGENELSDDALEKLKEIDAIMEYDASQVTLNQKDIPKAEDSSLEESLVSPDLDLDSINFGAEEELQVAVAVASQAKEDKKKKKKEEPSAPARSLGQDLKEISGAYSGEMERMQATISNLRTDREELMAKIQKLEEDKVLQSRQNLSMRAELDERKIELTIIRKKLNEEISELKDRLKLFDEKRLILEEKNRILLQELDKAAQKNKIDVKKVQMRERELEQKLELLKSDAETQIKHRDLKILELKRKIDAMEFDMESISLQEKRSVESRYELEDKLEKAIKTLRTAITVLEDESDRSNALSALKKNIDM